MPLQEDDVVKDLVASTEQYFETVLDPAYIQIALRPGTKRAVNEGWPSVMVSDRIEAGAPYGVLCGQRTNVIVVDLDVLKPSDSDTEHKVCGVKAWCQLVMKHGLVPGVPTIRTVSGGYHLYFKFEEGIKSSLGTLDPVHWDLAADMKIKIDVLVDGRYVVGPGSDGYSHWNFSECSAPSLPPWLKRILGNPKRKRHGNPTDALQPSSKRSRWCPGPGTNRQVSLEYVQKLVRSIPGECARPWEDWNRVVRAIAEVSHRNGFQGFDLAVEFSMRAPEKFKGPDDVRAAFNSGHEDVDVGTLEHYACTTGADDVKPEFAESLKRVDPHVLSVKSVDSASSASCIVVVCSRGGGLPERTFEVGTTFLDVRSRGDFERAGFLEESVVITEMLGDVNSNFPQGESRYNAKMGVDKIIIQPEADTQSRAYLEWRHPYKETTAQLFSVALDGRHTQKTKKEYTARLLESMKRAAQKYLKEVGVNVNAQCLIDAAKQGGRERVTETMSHYDLATAVMKIRPNWGNRLKCVPQPGKGDTVQFWYCHETTNIWEKKSVVAVQRWVMEAMFVVVEGLSDAARHNVGMDQTHVGVTRVLGRLLVDDNLLERMDVIDEGFVLDNGIWEFPSKTFRAIRPEDYVCTTAGWSYSSTESCERRAMLQMLLKQVFPNDEVRVIVLTYVAALLHGDRIDKHFLAFTDKRDGNTGKTTVLNLLRYFFGPFYRSGKKLLTGNVGESVNSHDGWLQTFRNARLVVCDELRSAIKLRSDFMKEKAGGQTAAEGRGFAVGSAFNYKWTAGMVFSFNDGDCPEINPGDRPLFKRMVAVPFLSKFSAESTEPNEELLLFPMDENVNTKENLSALRSSLLDSLSELCTRTGISRLPLPAVMEEYKLRITQANNPTSIWLEDNVTVTNNPDDYVTVRQLFEKFKREHGTSRMQEPQFVTHLAGYFGTHNIEMVDIHQRRGPPRGFARRAFVGARLGIEPEPNP